MKLGILQFELSIDGAEGLKDKRRVVKSLKDRLHREHMVSVAEIGAQELWNRAVLGLVCVSGDAKHLSAVLDRIIRKLDALPEARMVDCRRDVIETNHTGNELAEDGSPLWTAAERRDDGEGSDR